MRKENLNFIVNMKGGFTMYCFRPYELKQISIEKRLSERQSMEFDSIHWLNPLLYKCSIIYFRDIVT